MKKLLLTLLSLFFFSSLIQAQEFSIVIDGEKDAFYETLTGPENGMIYLPYRSWVRDIGSASEVGPDGNDDLSAIIWCAYDEEYLYYYLEVTDDFVTAGANDRWLNDNIEIKYDPDPDEGTGSGTSNMRLTALDSTTSETGAQGVDNINRSGHLEDPSGNDYFVSDEDYARKFTSNGYILEFRIPVEYINEPEDDRLMVYGEGAVFGTAINITDNDSGDRDNVLQWSAGMTDGAHGNADQHGAVTFLADNKLQYVAISPRDDAIVNDSAAVWYTPETVELPNSKYTQLSSGLVSMEIENYEQHIEQSDSYWEVVTDPEGFSGTSGMQANPIDPDFTDHKDINNAIGNAAILEYTVNFVSTDSVYVWARTSHVDGLDDSFWIGMDDVILGDDAVTYLTDEQDQVDWYWIRHWMSDESIVNIEVPSVGVHTIQIYMREQALKMDKLVLTTDPDYVPTGMGPDETLVGGTSVESQQLSSIPQKYSLEQNYPNPFNPSTNINFSLNESGYTVVKVYNMIGEVVETLVNQELSAGTHQLKFSANNIAAGVYFYRITSGDFTATKKMILLK